MNYIISQLWAAFNLYLTNRGIIPIPYPSIFITDPIIKIRFAKFCAIFKCYPRVIQTYFIYMEERYIKYPNLIPKTHHTKEIVESKILVGQENKITKIRRTNYNGKVCCWLMARRASKTTYINIRSVDLLQTPFGSENYAQQIYYGTKDDADEFFTKITTQLQLDKIKAKVTSTDGKVTKENNVIEFRYLSAKGGNRGHKPISVAVDEVGFISNKQLDLFMQAVEASMRDNKANIVFLTSPAESLENTYLTNLALNPMQSITFMLPAFFNNAKNHEGQPINSSLELIANTQNLVQKNEKFMVKTTVFGIPLLQGGREIFVKPHFYIFTKRSLDPKESPYDHIKNFEQLSEEERKEAVYLSDIRRKYGTPTSLLKLYDRNLDNEYDIKKLSAYKSIVYSFLVSDLSFSGVGDYTVIFHVGVSISGDIYIVNIFRQPTAAQYIENYLLNFLLDCLCTPHGESLKIMYIEGKHSDASVRIRTLKNMVRQYVDKSLKPYLLNNEEASTTRKDNIIKIKTLISRLENIEFGYINAKGGTFVADKTAQQLLHGATRDDLLYLSTSGSKIERARTAISVLSRISYITNEPMKIVFMCPNNDDYIINDIVSECLSIESRDLTTIEKKKGQANAHDDAFDTMVYALLVSEKINDAITRGFDINKGFKILEAERAINTTQTIKGALDEYNRKKNYYRGQTYKRNKKEISSTRMGKNSTII